MNDTIVIALKKDPRSPGRRLPDKETEVLLTSAAERLMKAVTLAKVTDVDRRADLLHEAVHEVADVLDDVEFEVPKLGADPMKLFVSDFGQLCEALHLATSRTIRKRLAKMDFPLPFGMDETDVKVRLLSALHQLIGMMLATYEELAVRAGLPPLKRALVH